MPLSPAVCKLNVALLGLLVLSLAPSMALAVCGDGVVDTGETCDDLNTAPGDGCGASCQTERGWTCAPASFSLLFDETLVDMEHVPPSWTISADALTVTQSQNADPAIYGSTLPAPGVTMGFTLAVNTTSDDDFIGWSIGYEQGENFQAGGDWLLFDWKQGTQDVNGNLANAGLRVWRVSGPVSGDWGFWGHNENITLVAEANTLGNTGWADNTTYDIEVSYATSGFRVFVDGNLEFDEIGVFPTGNFGFYNFSQQEIEYSLVSPLNQSVCSQDDSDGDGLVDLDEFALGTDPALVDTDGDGIDDLTEVGDPSNPTDTDGDGTIDAIDCDSDDPNVTNSVTEDSDCDGLLDSAEDVDGDGDPSNDDTDGDGTPNYLDDDSDGDGSPDDEDCLPNDADSLPGGTEICDGLDNDCLNGPDFDAAGEVDADADGSLSCEDCDDEDAANAPGGFEICDGQDNDCDGETSAAGGEDDADGDGSFACADCDDQDPANSPAGEEVCDGRDNDCDEETSAAGGEDDWDGDGSLSCVDCDDDDPANAPGNEELCDGQDNDCDGEANADGGEVSEEGWALPCASGNAVDCSCQSNLWSGSPSSLSPLMLLALVGMARRRRSQH